MKIIKKIDVAKYNSEAWNRIVNSDKSRYTRCVTHQQIEEARKGNYQLDVSPRKKIPRSWLPELQGLDVLCLASGGGQQSPIIAAAGANVTVLDNSPKQLEQDRKVAQEENLDITIELGDMADLSRFADGSFRLIIHPPSNMYTPDVRVVWREAFRVLRKGGIIISGISNPAVYLFNFSRFSIGKPKVKYSLPYSDLSSRSAQKLKRQIARGEPLAFSHTLEDQIGGQLAAGFVITGFYEDYWKDSIKLNKYMPCFMVTRAEKP